MKTLLQRVVDRVMFDTRKHDLNGWSKKDQWAQQEFIEDTIGGLHLYRLLELIR